MSVIYVTNPSHTPVALRTITRLTQENTLMLAQLVLHLQIRPRNEQTFSFSEKTVNLQCLRIILKIESNHLNKYL